MKIRLSAYALLLALAGIGRSQAGELLHLDFDDSAHLGAQTGTLATGALLGDAKPATDFPGSIEFGHAGGSVRIPGFHSPTGAFSVEARFRIHAYGPESSNFIANILNTVPEFHQGLAFRVGGGYLYPPLPRNAYKSESDWLAAQEVFSPVARERLSDCFPVFVMAGADGSWKEVYSDRCIGKDAWTHLVGTWDGSRMRIYIDGTEATDTWRTQGAEAVPDLGGTVDAYVGSRTASDFDPRHLEGAIDYVKVEEGALSANEIHARYKATQVPGARDSLCTGTVIPSYPEPGQLCKGKLELEFKIISNGACTDTAFIAAFLAGDSVEVEIAKDASFSDLVYHAVVAITTLRLDAAALQGLAGYQGALYWRVRLAHAKGQALAKSAAEAASEWSLSRPVVLDLSGATAIRAGAPARKPVLIQARPGLFVAGNASSREPVLFDLGGKRQPARFQRVAGGWRLNAGDPDPSGLFLIVRP